jgi:hypothetical protein
VTRNHIEHDIQVAIISHYRRTYAGRIFAIANGGYRGRIEAVKLKAEGVEPGVLDLCIINPTPRDTVRFVEVKAPGGVESDLQKAFIRDLIDMLVPVATVYSLDEAKRLFEEWQLVRRIPRPRTEAEIRTGF